MDREVDATSVGGGGGESHRRRSARRARFETAALGSPASDESTVGTALGDPWQCSADCSSCCSLVASVAIALVAPRPANGARANVAEVVPRFFASGSQVTGRASGAAANTSAEQWLFGWAAPTWQE